MRGLSLVAASGDYSSLQCVGFSLQWPLLLRSTGSRHVGFSSCGSRAPESVVVAHGLSCSAACGILPDQGSNPCPLHWQADSQPLRHQGSPNSLFFIPVLLKSHFFSYSVYVPWYMILHNQLPCSSFPLLNLPHPWPNPTVLPFTCPWGAEHGWSKWIPMLAWFHF